MFVSFWDNAGSYCYNASHIIVVQKPNDMNTFIIQFDGGVVQKYDYNSPDIAFTMYKACVQQLRGE